MRKTLCIVLVLLVLAIHAPAFGEEAFRSAKAMGNFSEGYAAFSDENDQWGYIDRQGNVVIAPAWNLADCFIGGAARVGAADHLYGYINTTGHEIFPTVCSAASDFHDGLATVAVDGEYGFIRTDGSYAFDGRWADAGYFSDGLAYVQIGGQYGFIDATGSVVIAPQWDRAYSFSEGYAAVEKDGLWGFIDTSGNVVIAPQYEDGVLFSDGLAPATKEGLSGYIDPAGNEVAPLQYERCSYVYQGRAWVKQNGMYRMIDKTGAQVGSSEWRNVFSDFGWTNLTRVNSDILWGYVNMENETVLNPVYEKATRFSDGLAAVRKGGAWYLIDETGVDVLSGENTQTME